MSVERFTAIILIFATITVAWMILGGAMEFRTVSLDDSLSAELGMRWGPKVLTQVAPHVAAKPGAGPADSGSTGPSASTINADIRHEHRYMGLLWYSTFAVDFEGDYVVAPAPGDAGASAALFVFPLPEGVSSYDRLIVSSDGQPVAITPAGIAAGRIEVPINRTTEHHVVVRYSTGGQDLWQYRPGQTHTTRSRDGQETAVPVVPLSQLGRFCLTVKTDFQDIDYPQGGRSPTRQAEPLAGGMIARWEYADALTNQPMGIVMPKRANAGAIAARMSFFAPVSLLFFFTAIFAIVVRKGIPLHPMHYLFVAAGVFAFHILMAYLVDLVNIHAAFWICAAVSVFLVTSYMRLVAGVRVGVVLVGLAQLVYLVGFSYAFFWVGKTGLTITIGAIATLFVLMQSTAKVDWYKLFARTVAPPSPAPGSAAPDAALMLPPEAARPGGNVP
jgi:hypothetical protein